MISFRNYIQLVENSFEDQISKLQLRYKEILRSIELNKEAYEIEYQEHLKDSAYDEMYEIEKEFIHRFRASIIIQLFSFLEVELKRYCEQHQRQHKKEYSINDLKGNNELDKIKKYLKQSANVEIVKFPEWIFLNDIRKLRNTIVHRQSELEKRDNSYNAIVLFSNNHFNLKKLTKDSFEIVLDQKSFIDKCTNSVEAFLNNVLNSLKSI